MKFVPERLKRLAFWVTERENVRRAKEAGRPKPWTKNEVLQSVRFCNVRRMDDKVSRWLLTEWYGSVGYSLQAAGIARLINWPDTLKVIINLNDSRGVWRWNTQRAIELLRAHRDAGNKIFTGAYIINGATNIGAKDKIETVCRQVGTMAAHPELVDVRSMELTHKNLMRVKGIGSFMAGQIVADLRHVMPGAWDDRHTWAPLGPGSRRGMAWLEGWDGATDLPSMPQAYFNEQITQLSDAFYGDKKLREIMHDRQLEAHDLQNCLCEFDKFMRLETGTGRAKNQYPGRA